MSHESRKALERIVALCEKSGNLTPRQVRIFDIALEGLGLVWGQRQAAISKWKQPHIERIALKRERQAARAAEAEQDEVAA